MERIRKLEGEEQREEKTQKQIEKLRSGTKRNTKIIRERFLKINIKKDRRNRKGDAPIENVPNFNLC
jgi:hypothetical protein